MTGEMMITQDVNRLRAFLVYLRDKEGFDGIDIVLRQLDTRSAMSLPPLEPPASPSTPDPENVTAQPSMDADHVADAASDGCGDNPMSGREPLYRSDIVDLALRIARTGSAIAAALLIVATLIYHFGH
jgi:hypothetical protein